MELAERPSVEKLGKLKLQKLDIKTERRLIDGTEKSPQRKSVDDMNEKELLALMKHVRVDDMYVEKLYRVGRLDDRSLKEVTKSYLRGGRYESVLLRELKPDMQDIAAKRGSLEDHYDRDPKAHRMFRANQEKSLETGPIRTAQDTPTNHRVLPGGIVQHKTTKLYSATATPDKNGETGRISSSALQGEGFNDGLAFLVIAVSITLLIGLVVYTLFMR